MLSSLVKNAAKIDILAPPGDTYKGSFWSLAGEIKGMDIGIPSTCSATHGVCLAEYISDEMDETYWRCEFDINDFKESRKASVFRAKG